MAKNCPFTDPKYETECGFQYCALYDEDNERCSILTLAKALDKIAESKIEDTMEKQEV